MQVKFEYSVQSQANTSSKNKKPGIRMGHKTRKIISMKSFFSRLNLEITTDCVPTVTTVNTTYRCYCLRSISLQSTHTMQNVPVKQPARYQDNNRPDSVHFFQHRAFRKINEETRWPSWSSGVMCYGLAFQRACSIWRFMWDVVYVAAYMFLVLHFTSLK